ncbi:hypothetical protein P9314_07025 [Paenibacillus validus]|uniref:Uncharacterized protein n=1 Tax=Paenibacillus validus TaxID=44253 RepID=A0A7X2Z9Z3_9BACL|nr:MULTISPECIES: hypothetical protein [Paenibacillus]MED4600454.1 hypothetical protein [Paenibacillus validus]MED4604714.1 hypothetical protein [Paenibacillus validus]MUG71059.1 hypothetical protein [Paenibacillus validus]
MRKGKNKSMNQTMQSMADHSNQAVESKAYTMPTYHKDKHEPNRPSI